MTALGKLLVFLNVFAAAGVLAWSVSAYANRVNYLDTKTGDGQTAEGQITRLKKEIADVSAAIATGSARYGANSRALLLAENARDRRAYVLAQRLDQARRGAFFDYPKDPGNSLFDNVLAPGTPIQFRGAPLRGVAAVQADLERETMTVRTLVEGTREFDRQVAAAVATAAGTPDLPQALEGLGIINLRRALGVVSDRVAVVDDATRKQRDILANLEEEREFLRNSRVNWVAQLQTLDRRHRQLQAQLTPYGGR